jgi:hypothetical protein
MSNVRLTQTITVRLLGHRSCRKNGSSDYENVGKTENEIKTFRCITLSSQESDDGVVTTRMVENC